MILRLYAKLLRTALNESKKNFLTKQYGLTTEQVDEIASHDPTNAVNKNTYTAWLCKVVKDGKSIDSLASLTEPLKKFMRLLNSPEFPAEKKDIGKYSPESLLQLVGSDRKYRRNLSQSAIEKMIITEGIPGAKLIWNSDGFKMWEVSNPEYARFLSSNTSWCTAQVPYSTSYCSKGALFPVYFKGKPLAQGYYASGVQDITFLDVQDNSVKLSDPIIMGMLQTIVNEPMNIFRKRVLSDSGYMHRMGDTWEDIKPAAELALKMNIPYGVKTACESYNWPEGFEYLLDYPKMLHTVVADRSSGLNASFSSKYPELAEEIIYEASKVGNKSDLTSLAFALPEDQQREFFDGKVESFIRFSDLDLNSPLIEELLKKEINASEDEKTVDTETILSFMNNNDWGFTESALLLWRKFYHKDISEYSKFEEKVKTYPEYQERLDIINKIPTRYRIGDIIEMGPDYTGEHTGNAKIVAKDSRTFTLDFEDGSSVTTMGNNPKKGHYWLGVVVTPSEAPLAFEPLKERPNIREVKKGMRVVIEPTNWRHSDHYNPDEEEMGTITEVDRYDETVRVIWDNDAAKKPRGAYNYHRIQVVRDLSVKPEKPKPASKIKVIDPLPVIGDLKEGMKVTRGPDWPESSDSVFSDDFVTGVINEIHDASDDLYVKVMWYDETGAGIDNYLYYYKPGNHQVAPYEEVKTQTKKVPMDPLPSFGELEVGMKVMKGPQWNKEVREPSADITTGIITKLDGTEGEGRTFIYINWDGEGERERGGYYYTDEIKRAIPYNEVEEEVDAAPANVLASKLPVSIPVGQRIKRGPTWHWGEQDEDEDGNPGEGEITEEANRDGWLQVTWDNGEAQGYRYGWSSNEVCADVVPFDFDYDFGTTDIQEIRRQLETVFGGNGNDNED